MIAAAIALAGAGLVLALRYAGVLQGAELYAYDMFLAHRARNTPAANDQIALVEVNEEDIAKFDYPLPDLKLAELLNKIESEQPAAIGLDLYRDLPVPRSGQDLKALASVLDGSANIICTFKFGDADHPFEIPPPAILRDRLDRIGFNDFPFDYKSVRRAFLYIADAAGNTYVSFALQLASLAGVNPEAAGTGLVGIGGAPVYKFAQNTGGYINAADGGYQFLLDFKGPRTFTRYSLDEVLNGRVPARAFAGKVVLIGQSARSGKDYLMTPVREDEPGVELHAWVVDQLLRMAEKGDRVLRAWSGPAQAAWLILWCAIGAGIGFHCRSPVALTGAALAMVALLFYCCWRAFDAGWWAPFIPPLAGSLPVTAMVASFMGYREKRDRNTLMSIFSRHVSKGVAETIWEQRDLFTRNQRLIPQRLTATVLFTDLQNFSTVAEGMEPEVLLAWINEYMEMLVRHIERCGGMVNKYMGDSIMAVFGAPVPSTTAAEIERDACNAVKCALAMGRELTRLNLLRRAEGRPTTNMRVGIHTGPAVSGSIGSSKRLEFTVLGDTVNTASRLESFDKDFLADQICRILIGETTRDLVGHYFKLKFVKTIELKGQHEKTDIYSVPPDENSEEGRLDGRGASGRDVSGDLPGAGGHAGALSNAQAAEADLPSADSR